jgi:hypothetical protein
VLILVTKQTVLMDVSRLMIERLARALRVEPSLVKVNWVQENGSISPRIDVELPPIIPPADVDVTDPVAMAAWEAGNADLPGIYDFLKARGIDNPEAIIKHQVAVSMADLKARMGAFRKVAA